MHRSSLLTLSVSTLVVAALAAPAAAQRTGAPYRHDKTIADTDKLPLSAFSPLQQAYKRPGHFSDLPGALIYADMLGDKLSASARFALVETCLTGATFDGVGVLKWAVCADDARKIDLDAIRAERKAGGLPADDGVMNDFKATRDKLLALGATVDAAAPDDKGIRAIQDAVQGARADWDAFAATHGELIALARALEDGVRVGHEKHFAGCLEKTQPAFAKVARARAWKDGDDYLQIGYAGQLRDTLVDELTALAWGACAYGLHESAQGVYGALSSGTARTVARGPRSLAWKRLMQESFKPAFSDRALSLGALRTLEGDKPFQAAVNVATIIGTPSEGTITKLEKQGDVTVISFKSGTTEACLAWVDSDKVERISGGEVTYKKRCARRGTVNDSLDPIEVATMFTDGLKPGQRLIVINSFPVVAWTGATWHAIFGVALK